jgi:D-ribose pyranase
MKKTTLLNQPISSVIAGLGHTDTLVVADAGLPIPPETRRIDLALKAGVPGFIETLRTVLSEMQVEKAIIAEEMTEVSPQMFAALKQVLGDVPIEMVSHLIFKEMTRNARAVVRTGEFTPYANVILVSGVTF